MPRRKCCCGPGAAPAIRIDVLRALAAYGHSARNFGDAVAGPGSCPGEEDDPPTYGGATTVGWACDYSRSHEAYAAHPGTPTHHWNLCTEEVSAESYWHASKTWTLPFVSSRTENSSGTWKLMTSGGLVTTTATAFVSQQVDDYSVTESHASVAVTGDACSSCSSETGTPASVTIDASYWHRATYRFDMVAFQVYADSGAHSSWTIEVTSTECIVKDGSTVKYTWALASYTIAGLRAAIGATSELSALGGLAALGSVGGQSASLIPVQAAAAVGISSAPVSIMLRRAGDLFEDYQSFGYPRYEVEDYTAVAPAFSGTESQFATGFEIYWTPSAIAGGTNMTEWDSLGAAPTVALELSDFGLCTSEGLPVDPPIYVEPTCAGGPGSGIDSIPAGGGRTSFHGDAIRPRTGGTQEFNAGGATGAYWAVDNSCCGSLHGYYRCVAFTTGAAYGKRCKWQLTRT